MGSREGRAERESCPWSGDTRGKHGKRGKQSDGKGGGKGAKKGDKGGGKGAKQGCKGKETGGKGKGQKKNW